MTPFSFRNFCRFRLIFAAFFLIAFSTISHSAQIAPVPSSFVQIIPGVSNRNDVEKIYGKGEDNKYSEKYYTKGLEINVLYSRGKCNLSLDNLNLLEWTVESISYEWNTGKEPRLNKILLDKPSFKRVQSGDVLNHDTYVHDDQGISIVYDRKIKGVIGVYLDPARKIKVQRACGGIASNDNVENWGHGER